MGVEVQGRDLTQPPGRLPRPGGPHPSRYGDGGCALYVFLLSLRSCAFPAVLPTSVQ